MRPLFQELDRQTTPMGQITLRRRLEPTLGVDVYEAKLDDEYLMSSLFTGGEVELARLALDRLDGHHLNVIVGGLGLGYTAAAVLDDPRVHSLSVIEALPEVIRWHEHGLVPLGRRIWGDDRCRLITGDFFRLTAGVSSVVSDQVDAVLLDIDHSPRRLLHPDHAEFYTEAALRNVTHVLRPGGLFALWSDDRPDHDFVQVLQLVFANVETVEVTFPNPYTGASSSNTIYLAG